MAGDGSIGHVNKESEWTYCRTVSLPNPLAWSAGGGGGQKP